MVPRAGKYIPSRVALTCPGLGTNSDLFSNAYWYAEYCGYSYCVPLSASNPGALFAWKPHQFIPASGMADSSDWAGASVPHVPYRWDALVACYTQITTNPSLDGPPPSQSPPMFRPHKNKGLNVLYSDGSARWLARPSGIPVDPSIGFTKPNGFPQIHAGWPSLQPITTNPPVENGNCHDNDPFWRYVNKMY